MNNEASNGFLIVNVTTARGAIPLADATVTVSQLNGGVDTPVAVVRTDIDGKTEKLTLQAPPPDNSQTPNPTGPSYALYNVEVVKNGYYTENELNIPVFSGITSIQPVRMLPYIVGRNTSPQSNSDVAERRGYDLNGNGTEGVK